MTKKTSLPGNKLVRWGKGGICLGVAQGLALLDAAVIAMAVGIFEAQAHLWTIFFQVEQLLTVERSSTLPGRNNDNVNSFQQIFINRFKHHKVGQLKGDFGILKLWPHFHLF